MAHGRTAAQCSRGNVLYIEQLNPGLCAPHHEYFTKVINFPNIGKNRGYEGLRMLSILY